jgi:hypothetical protein
MNLPPELTGDYEKDRQNAEQTFRNAWTDWLGLLTKEAEQAPLPQEGPDVNELLLAQIAAAALRGETVDLDMPSDPPVRAEILKKLAELCREYATRELWAYADHLRRKGIPPSHIVSELDAHAKATLEEVRRRKWNYSVEQISEFFECQNSAEEAWHGVERFIEAMLREIIEPEIWSGCIGDTVRLTIDSHENIAQAAIPATDGAPSRNEELPPYWGDPTPLHYFDRWPLEGLGSASRSQIKAGLRKVHAEFLEDKAGELPEIHWWCRAYDVFAIQFEEASLLTEDIIRKTIPAMVADAGASGRWASGRSSSIMPSGDRAQRLGQEYYHPDRIRVFLRLIEGRIVEWSGKLDLQHSKEDGGALGRPEPNDGSETLISWETDSPDAHRAPVISFEQSKEQEPDQARRAKARSDWLDQKLAQHQTWTSDSDIAEGSGLVYNTIQRYRSGATSTRGLYVRRGLAKAFQCEIGEVPE